MLLCVWCVRVCVCERERESVCVCVREIERDPQAACDAANTSRGNTKREINSVEYLRDQLVP